MGYSNFWGDVKSENLTAYKLSLLNSDNFNSYLPGYAEFLLDYSIYIDKLNLVVIKY